MRIGLCGAHRTGKSTLAREYGKIAGLPFLATSTMNVAQKTGFDINKDNSFARRLEYQIAVLDMMEDTFKGKTSFVSDRTPLDAAAYLLAEIKSFTGDADTQEAANIYIDCARKLTSEMFDIVVIVPPAISVAPVKGKPLVNPAFQEHIHFLISGMLFDPDMDVKQGQLLRDNTSISDRIESILDFGHQWQEETRQALAT